MPPRTVTLAERLGAGTASEGYVLTIASGVPTWASGGGGGTSNHAALSNRVWTASGHTGTANRIAAFDGGGAAAYLQIGVDVQAYSAALATIGALTLGTTNGHTLRVSGGAWGVGTLDASSVASGVLGTARLGTGTATGAVLVDGAWVAGSSSGHVLRWNGSAWASSALSANDISTGAIGNLARLGYSKTTSDATATDNTTGTTTNTPSWSVTTGKTYMLRAVGTMKSSIATNGWRVSIQESGGASSSKCVGVCAYVGAGDEPITAAGAWTAAGAAPTSETFFNVEVLYVCTGTGTIKLALRGEGSGPTVTMYAGTVYSIWEYP